MTREAQIHFELYRHLKNAIDKGVSHRGVTFSRVEPEYNVNSGFADIVIFDDRDHPWLVIEAKRQTTRGYDRNIDPFSPVVIRQAFRYAGDLGAEYFATYNGRVLVLFHAFERGIPLLQRKSRAYSITKLETFAFELLKEIVELEDGVIKWDPKHQAFIARLGEFHHRLANELHTTLLERLEDKAFKERYENWIKSQGWGIDNLGQVHRTFVAQAAYLLMDKLLFYKILEDEPAYRDLPRISLWRLDNLAEELQALFRTIVEEHDFEPIYQRDPIFDELPLTERAASEIGDFLEELEAYDLSQFDQDVIGEIYQRVIPPKERHDLGQYYTPPAIVELICRLTIRSPDDRILDPGCGSGGFLVGAYNRLRELKQEAGQDSDHTELLSQIYGIDINRFPAHLSAINLALRNLSQETRKVNLLVGDFFDVGPKEVGLLGERAGTRGAEGRAALSIVPGKVEVVVANPPYIRQEKIALKKDYRKHLSKVKANLNRRSDIYAYFFTHATEFLVEGGRIGFITSDRWLSVGYGEGLQEFFLNNFCIKAIIVFNRQIFEDPLIGTCVTILERCSDPKIRDENTILFLLVKQRMSLGEILEVLETDRELDVLYEEEKYRIIALQQGDLCEETKWHRYLYAPTLYWELIATGQMVPLSEVASVAFALKTGANDFFYFRNKDEAIARGIPEEFLAPLLKNIAETDYIELRREDLEWHVLGVHDFVQRVLEEADPEGRKRDPARLIKKALQNKGYTALLDYIEQGEERGIHKRPSIRDREVWFDLGSLPKAPIFLGKEYWKNARVLHNTCNAVPDQRIYTIIPKEGIPKLVLLGILNSSITAVIREMHGREEQGEGMNRNTLTVYEAAAMPILDPRKLSEEQCKAICTAIEEIVRCERKATQEELEELHKALDRAVLAPLGMEDRVDELYEVVQFLVRFREEGGGEWTEVLVEGTVQTRERREITLRGAQRINKKIPKQQSLF